MILGPLLSSLITEPAGVGIVQDAKVFEDEGISPLGPLPRRAHANRCRGRVLLVCPVTPRE